METHELFIEAFRDNRNIRATVRVDDETRIRVGSVAKIGSGYVTIKLEDGSFRSTRNDDVISVEIIPTE